MRARAAFATILPLACALCAAPAAAQSSEQAAEASAAPAAGSSLDEAKLADSLRFDPAAYADKPVKPLRLPKPLSIDVTAKLGADTAPSGPSFYQPGAPLPGTVNADSGAAWGSVGVPDVASLNARLDPGNDQGKVGTTLQHAVPIGSDLSVTLQDTFSVSDSSRALAAAPLADQSPGWDNEKKFKFDILPTGTSLAAGVLTSSTDPVSHDSLSADQKIFGPLHVTTALNDIGQPTTSKSVKASLKLNW